jgi:hypothetical protein
MTREVGTYQLSLRKPAPWPSVSPIAYNPQHCCSHCAHSPFPLYITLDQRLIHGSVRFVHAFQTFGELHGLRGNGEIQVCGRFAEMTRVLQIKGGAICASAFCSGSKYIIVAQRQSGLLTYGLPEKVRI